MPKFTWVTKLPGVGPAFDRMYMGTISVASVGMSSTSRGKYRWTVLLPGLQNKYQSGDTPSKDHAKAVVEKIVKAWVRSANMERKVEQSS